MPGPIEIPIRMSVGENPAQEIGTISDPGGLPAFLREAAAAMERQQEADQQG